MSCRSFEIQRRSRKNESSLTKSGMARRFISGLRSNKQSTIDERRSVIIPNVIDKRDGPALPAFLGIEGEDDLDRPEVKTLMKDASPISHLSEDDHASVYMFYSRPRAQVTRETESLTWVHDVQLGLKLQEAMEELDRECIVTAPDLPNESSAYSSLEDFLIQKAKGGGASR